MGEIHLHGKISFFVIFTLFAYQTALFSQVSRSNPGLSDKQLLELLNDTTRRTARTGLADSVYVPPPGAKYTEIRSVDPAAPPAIIDIVGNLNNKKAFKLSDIASSVKYIQLQQPPGTKITSISDIVSDDDHIFVSTLQGLFCYAADGQYLYTLTDNELERSSTGVRIVSGVMSNPLSSTNIDLLDGQLTYRTYHWPSIDEGVTEAQLNIFDVNESDAQMRFNFQSGELKNKLAQPVFQRRLDPKKSGGGIFLNDQSFFIPNSLTTVSLYGDTVCKFSNFDRPMAAQRVTFFSYAYRVGNQVMLQNDYNDTIFRVEPPNRLVPVYVMQWGAYKPDKNQYAAGSELEGKLVLDKWVETARYIFISYTEGRDYPIRRNQGKVLFHWALYDKTAKTLTHFLTSSTPPMVEITTGVLPYSAVFPPLIENDIEPVGMPFWPKGVNHNDEMYMIFSKEQIKNYITTGQFRNDKLQTIHDNMPDDGFCIMVVK